MGLKSSSWLALGASEGHQGWWEGEVGRGADPDLSCLWHFVSASGHLDGVWLLNLGAVPDRTALSLTTRPPEPLQI